MKPTRLDEYLGSLQTSLKRLSPAEREAQLLEVRGHLEALIASHVAQGKNLEDATRLAISQFGAPERIAGELNQVALRARLVKRARSVGIAVVVWCCLWGGEFAFFTTMNDKVTDFPFLLKDRLILSAALASFAFLGVNPAVEKMFKAWKARRASS